MIESRRADPEEFTRGLSELFRLMSDRAAGRFFGNERVEWFDGGLFDGAEVIPCTRDELDAMHEAALLDWSRVEPAILGTLFERGLDPDKRGQLGAHYTDHAKIMLVVEPVVLDPLRREFAAMRERVEELAAGREPSALTREGRRRERLPPWERDAEAEWRAFLERLRAVRVLDPACGSGNFLYVTLRLLKDLEEQAIRWGGRAAAHPRRVPAAGPAQRAGHRAEPVREGAGGRLDLDRAHPVDAGPRLRLPARPGVGAARQHRAARRDPRPRRRGFPQSPPPGLRPSSSSATRHSSGRKRDADCRLATSTSTSLFASVGRCAVARRVGSRRATGMSWRAGRSPPGFNAARRPAGDELDPRRREPNHARSRQGER